MITFPRIYNSMKKTDDIFLFKPRYSNNRQNSIDGFKIVRKVKIKSLRDNEEIVSRRWKKVYICLVSKGDNLKLVKKKLI